MREKENELEHIGTPEFLKVSLPPMPEWWETPSIPLKISDLRVRNRLNALLHTDLVQLLDRKYMTSLDEAIRTTYKRRLYERIRDRQKWEFEREKKLVVEGRIPLEDGPPELNQHPMFIVKDEVKRIVDERRAKREARKKKYKIPPFNYKLLSHMVSRGHLRSISEVSQLSGSTADLDMVENQRVAAQAKLQEEFDQGLMYTPEQYSKLKYTPEIIKEIMDADTVDQMYKMATNIFLHDTKLTEAINKIEEKGKVWDELSMAPSMILSNISMVPSTFIPPEGSSISLVRGAPAQASYIPEGPTRKIVVPQASSVSLWEASEISMVPSTTSAIAVPSNVSVATAVFGKDIKVIRKEEEGQEGGEAAPPQQNQQPAEGQQ